MESSDYLKLFGKNLAHISKENGFTQRDMPDYKISRAYYGRIEVGEHAPTVDTLFLLARAFGVRVCDFFIDKDGNPI